MDEFKPPARRAMAVLDTPEPDSVPAPKRRVSRKLLAAIDAMVMGECKDVTQAAAKVGMARESVSRALRKPHISQLLRSKTRQRLDTAAARAGAVKVELLDSPNEVVRDRASDFVLALAGIAPAKDPAVAVNVNIRAGYIIDLSEPDERPPLRIVSP